MKIADFIKAEKQKVSQIIEGHLINVDIGKNKGKQAKQELVDVGKFITCSGENIKIIDTDFQVPDLLIEWDGIPYGLEHTEVVDEKKKVAHEKTNWLVQETEKAFIQRYGNIQKRVTISLNFEVTKITKKEKKRYINALAEYKQLNLNDRKLMNHAHPGYLTEEDIKQLAEEFADLVYISFKEGKEVEHELVTYISFEKSNNTSFDRTVGWSSGSIHEILIEKLEDKESKIATYIKNTKGLKQCLFMLIHGSNGYSDYSYFDDKILAGRYTPFDKVIAFNFFTGDFFILK